MDWSQAIETHRAALKRVLAMLVAMAELAGLTSPLVGEDGSARRGEAGPLAEPGEGPFSGNRPTLPRHLHRAALRLLRPAEAAARRLVIVAARGLVVASPPRLSKPHPTQPIVRNGIGTGIVMPRGLRSSTGPARTAPRSHALPLFDPLPRWNVLARPRPSGFPRISIPGLTQPCPVPRAPSPDDPIDATRLALRLGALTRALDDLSREAKRFARWRAARHTAGAQNGKGNARRFRRVWPLRPGRPPGGRLAHYDPDTRRRQNIRDVDEILAHVHALALYALGPDTS